MKLSKTSAYAALAMGFLSTQPRQVMVQARQVAEFLSIPVDSALKILQTLARHGLIESQLGRSGGYRLTADPEQISLLNVVEAVDGPLSVEMPVTNPSQKIAPGLELLHLVYAHTTEKIREQLGRTSVAELARCDRSEILHRLTKAT